MRRLTTPRRRAEEFAAAVDDRRADVSTLDEHADLRAFLDLVAQLRDLEQPSLREEFSTDLRARLMAEAPEALTNAPASRPATRGRPDSRLITFPASPRRRTATALATAAVVLGSTAGVAAASQSALPGETLYPVKRGIENLELAIAGSQHAEGSEYLDQAGTRLDEVTDLSVAHADDPSTPGLVARALDDFASETGDGADALMRSYRQDHDDSSIADLRTFTEESARRLDALTGSIPASANQELADAAELLRRLDERARSLCPACSDLPALALSSSLIELQDALPVDPGLAPSTQGPDPSQGAVTRKDRPTPSGATTGGSSPSASDSTPVLPNLTSPLGDSTPTVGSTDDTDATTTTSVPGGGVEVSLPGGGVTISAPSVPLPTVTVDLEDPLGSVPQVIDAVTTSLPQLP